MTGGGASGMRTIPRQHGVFSAFLDGMSARRALVAPRATAGFVRLLLIVRRDGECEVHIEPTVGPSHPRIVAPGFVWHASVRPMTDRAFYRRWVVTNGWAEAAGLGTTLAVGRSMAPLLDRATGVASILAAAVLAVILGALLEGVLVGVAQERVLRRRLERLRPWSWTVATAVGAALAWLLGMVPSTIMALGSPEPAASAPTEPGMVVQYGLAVALGLVAGPILGLAQWTVLRGLVAHAGRWLWANALAWAVGMPLIFAGMDVVPWTLHPAVVVLVMYAVCGTTGLVVGAIHGLVLVRLLRISGHGPPATGAR